MHQEHKEIELALELVSRQFEFLEDSRAPSSIAKNSYLKGGFGRDRPMKRRLLINSRDEVSIDRIIAVK